MELNDLLCLLEERLVQHDGNRREVQDKLEKLCTGMSRDADLLEERLNEELQRSFNEREESTLNLIEKLNNIKEDDRELVIEKAQKELSTDFKYEIQYFECKWNFVNSYKLKITQVKTNVSVNVNDIENIINQLKEHLNGIHSSFIAAQNELAEICTNRRNDAEELKKRINEKLESLFTQEDARIQEVVKMIKDKSGDENTEEIKAKAKTMLLVNQKYSLSGIDLAILKRASLKCIDSEKRKPTNIIVSFTDKGEFSISFTFFDNDEIELLKTVVKSPFKVIMKIWDKGNQSEEENAKIITKDYTLGDKQICFVESFRPNTVYCVIMRIEHDELSTKWSDGIEFKTPEFKACVWKEFPDNVVELSKYLVNMKNPRIATSFNGSPKQSTIIGNTPLPPNKVTSWSIKILKSKDNNGNGIFIGVAPFDINQDDDDNHSKCGWYFYCDDSTLCSGPPHRSRYKEYGPRKMNWGEYIHTGDTVGVVMDTSEKGELTFVLNEVNYGIAYKGIPLDKPLVPCVILFNRGDSVELDTSEVKETVVGSSISVPTNISTKSITCDSITLTWNYVEGVSFYQIETDGNKSWDATTANTFTKIGLLSETEHNFRVRVVKGSSVSEWSDVVKGKTLKAHDFSECDMAWKECPNYVSRGRKYSVNKNNPKIVTNNDSFFSCSIIGNTPLLLNKVTSWNIKILKSLKNDGKDIYVGVSPSNINLNEYDNFNKCGWYFKCYNSTLYSGPPHYYSNKEYGPRKEYGGYVHTGNNVGVMMDIMKSELSFTLNGLNLDVAYEGIPLDNPLVPCVILRCKGDSVEIDASSEKKEIKLDTSVPIPTNIVSRNDMWDSITITWDAVEGASFYQIEVDGIKLLSAVTISSFTKRGLLSETEYSFRIRAMKMNTVSEWSDIIKLKTLKVPEFKMCVWKECPDYVDLKNKYSVDENNPRIATCIGDYCCTIIGNTHFPLNNVTSWNIKILKSFDNGGSIYIGVAPFDINQNEKDNYNKCGWYFDCYFSVLYSGPPHDYIDKEYGPRKKEGECVHTGDSVGVVMDTTKGELSFILDEVNLGVAIKRIPLDKPLVPCVILCFKDDSVEFVI